MWGAGKMNQRQLLLMPHTAAKPICSSHSCHLQHLGTHVNCLHSPFLLQSSAHLQRAHAVAVHCPSEPLPAPTGAGDVLLQPASQSEVTVCSYCLSTDTVLTQSQAKHIDGIVSCCPVPQLGLVVVVCRPSMLTGHFEQVLIMANS